MSSFGHHDDPLAPFPTHFGFRVVAPCIIIEPLGEGAMGFVYRGRHYNLDVDVAVKFLRRELASNREYVIRFQREARIAASIKQENLVGVFDTLDAHGLYYTVMELVDGETVEGRVRRKGPLSPAEALSITIPAVRALAALHERRVFHRDVKPSNIIVSRGGTVKLADLGIARDDERFDTLKTHADALIGTPHYMAPEQFDDPNKVGDRADVYAMALTLAFMLRGDHVVEGKSLPEVIRRACEQPVPGLPNFYPDAPSELCELFTQMTAKDPQQRPDARRVIAQMNRALFALGHEVDLADPEASRSYGTAGLPSKLDRSRVQQIKQLMTRAAVPASAVAGSIARAPSGYVPTLVEPPQGSTVPVTLAGPPTLPKSGTAPPRHGSGFRAVALIALLLALAGAAALGLNADWRKRAIALVTGGGEQPTPPVVASQPPTISKIADQSTLAGQTIWGITFKVADDRTPPGDVVVTAEASNGDLIPRAYLMLGGAGADRTLNIRTGADMFGKTTVLLTARDAEGNTGSTTFAMEVTSTPPKVQPDPKPDVPPATNAPPTISSIADVTLDPGATTPQPIAFTVDDDRTSPDALRVTCSSSEDSVVRGGNLRLAGAGKQRNLRVQAERGRSGVAEISVTVSDEAGASSEARFRVTVKPLPNTAPRIAEIPDQSLRYNEVSKAISFEVDDEEPARLAWVVESDNPDLLPPKSMTVSSVGKTCRLLITHDAARGFGTSRVTLRATDAAGQIAERAFNVTIDDGVNEIVAAATKAAAEPRPRWQVVFNSLDDALGRTERRGDAREFHRLANPVLEQFRKTVPSEARARTLGADLYRQRLQRQVDVAQSSVAALLLVESLLEYNQPFDPALRHARANEKAADLRKALDLCTSGVNLPDPQYALCAYAADIRFQHVPPNPALALANSTEANRWLALGCEKGDAETCARAAHYLLQTGAGEVLGVAANDRAARFSKAKGLSKQAAEGESILGCYLYGRIMLGNSESGARATAERYLVKAALAGHADARKRCSENGFAVR